MTIIAIICACVGSSGLWACIQAAVQARHDKKAAEDKEQTAAERLLMGLAYAKLMDLCTRYLERGYITKEEYRDLKKYVFEPYEANGGDGTAAHMVEQVDQLPVRG